MPDLLEVARQHPWWYSDQNLANLLVAEVERLRGLLSDSEDSGEWVDGEYLSPSPEWYRRVREALGHE